MPDEDDELMSFLADASTSNGSTGQESSSFGLGSFAADDPTAPMEEPVVEEPIRIGDGSCSVCGEPTFRPPGLTRTGRQKRAPKYCELHDPKNEAKFRAVSFGAPSGSVEAQLRKIQGELVDDLMLFGSLSGPFFPVTGLYIVDNAEAFTIALLKLCKNNPKVMRLLHRTAQVAPVYQIARFGAGVATSVQVDQKKADPHSMMADRLGVARVYDILYAETNTKFTSTPSNGSNTNFSGPPRYAGVQ